MTSTARRRALLLTSNFPRWSGDSTTPFVHRLALGLQEAGWRIDVLAPHAPGAAPREVLDGVRVERFRYAWPASQETVCYQGGALINLRERRSNLLKVPLLVAAEWAAARRRLAGRRYDLLHAHWILPQGFVGALVSRRSRVPHVLTAHGGDVFALQGQTMRAFKRYALHRADAVTVNSSVTESAVQELAPRVRHLARIPMGVADVTPDPGVVAELRRIHRRGDGPLLAFVGRLVEEKGVEDLLEAVRLLEPALPQVTAVVAGEGQARRALEEAAAARGLRGRVTFAGWVDPQAVPAYLAAADVAVVPSRQASDGWIEAQGLSAVEAMAVGTPVVASASGGLPDAVIDERTGLLVPERAPERIADAVRRLAADPDLGSRLSEGGRRLVAERFSATATATAFAELFEELLSRRRRAR